MDISQILKKQRKEKQLTQSQLAEIIYVSKKTISNWENGRTTPDIKSVIHLATLFELSLDELLIEDSKLVNELKKKEQFAELTKIYWLGPIATSLLLLVLMYLPEKTASLWKLLIISLASCTNIATILYFQMKRYRLKGKDEKLRKELKQSQLFFFGLVLFACFFFLFLYFC